MNCEGIPRQVNFLSGEAGNCGKGANTVISQLRYYFENHGLGNMEVFALQTTAQGRTKTALWYSPFLENSYN